MLLIDDDDGPDLDRRDHGRRSAPRCSDDDHARADGGGDLERAEHPAHVDAARPAHRGVRALREAARSPSRRSRARRVAAQLMVELSGARLGRRHDRRRRRRAARRRRSACATRSVDAAARRRGPARRAGARSSSALGFGVADAGDGLDVTVPALAPRRRHPRGRPDRGGRAPLGAREAARRRCPRAAARRGRLDARAAAAPPRRGRARRRRPLRGARLELRRAGAVERLRLAADDRAPRRARCATRCPRSSR